MTTRQSTASAVPRQTEYEAIPLRMHPRVFESLGADLVTNDVVAVIELVKNSYDAFARNVRIEFGKDPGGETYLEIGDDGLGMTGEVIRNAWSLVATPHKASNDVIARGAKTRRVSGYKGLGRLSAARLGDRLVMLTQAPQSVCWEVTANWPDISSGDDISQSTIHVRKYTERSPFAESGTIIRILGLKEPWDQNQVEELDEGLGRLLSPFNSVDEFHISLCSSDRAAEKPIESLRFLSEPKYSVAGEVDNQGNVEAVYRFSPIGGDLIPRLTKIRMAWSQIHGNPRINWRFPHSEESARCGPFSFDIRAWDINPDGTEEISSKYGIAKRQVRTTIRAHKGISVYRDGILVLPKSEGARDWLGLDLRRVSQVGRRLSTSQLVGYVSISGEHNPKIDDTSDRERLSMCAEVEEFQEIVKTVVDSLASHRNQDRPEPSRELPIQDLLAEMSASELVTSANALAQSGGQASEVVRLIQEFDESLSRNRQVIQQRFVYYSRLATIGTIAQMLVHEIRNRTIAIGSLLSFIKREPPLFQNANAKRRLTLAENAVSGLEQLADRFAPLANRNFHRGRRHSVLENEIRNCMALTGADSKGLRIQCVIPTSTTVVATDPGELDAIIINLVENAMYWMQQPPNDKRKLEFQIEPSNPEGRVTVWVNDTGPGIDEEYAEQVFYPGVTRKPDGIGMGLTVASELVSEYGGKMRTVQPGLLGGASFAFDLPCVASDKEENDAGTVH